MPPTARWKDFAPVILTTTSPFVLVAPTGSNIKSVQDVIDMTRAKPGQVRYGTVGVGSFDHISSALSAAMAKVRLVRLAHIAGPLPRQALQRRPLGFDALGVTGVLAADDLVDEPAVTDEVVEISGATHQQRVVEGLLEMAVSALDGAVLVCDAAVVAGGLHAVMGAQRVVVPGQVLAGIAVQVAECGREAVATMLERRAPSAAFPPASQAEPWAAPPSAHSAFCNPAARAT